MSGPGLVAMLRDLVDDDCMGPWRPEALEVDEFAPAPVWLENDAGDLLRVDVAAVALVMSVLPALLDAAEAARDHAHRDTCDPCPICDALDELDAGGPA